MPESPKLPKKVQLVARMRPGRSGLKTYIRQNKEALAKRAIESNSDAGEPVTKNVRFHHKLM